MIELESKLVYKKVCPRVVTTLETLYDEEESEIARSVTCNQQKMCLEFIHC